MKRGSTGRPAAQGAPGAGVDAGWQFVRDEVDRQLEAFARRRKRDKRKAFGLQLATVTLSATVTVLLGLRTSEETRTRMLNIALVLGALITVLAAAEAFFSHRRLWVLRTATVRRLEALSRHVDFRAAVAAGQPVDTAATTAYLDELDAIISDDQKSWQHLRQEPPAAHDKRLSAPAEQSRDDEEPDAVDGNAQ
ncbi:SLATT domain-containing protein [Streptomyces sp. NPDC004561]